MDWFSQIPTEAITGLASAALGGWLKLQKQKQEAELARNADQRANIAALDRSAADAKGRGGAQTRRWLALMAGSYLFLWPVVIALLWAFSHGVGTTLLYEQSGGGLWGWVQGTQPKLFSSGVVYGYILTPVHTHVAASVFFFYFGAGVVKR